jgi:hypothetical protein
MATTLKHSTHNPLHMAIATILFTVILLFGILGLMRYAHGWGEVASMVAAATTPTAADGLVAFISALITAVGAVWVYVAHLAR